MLRARVTKADLAIRHQLPVNYELTQVRIVHVAISNYDCGTVVTSLGAQGLAYTHNTHGRAQYVCQHFAASLCDYGRHHQAMQTYASDKRTSHSR